jgi:DNA-binding XRE family transcriptional regulator
MPSVARVPLFRQVRRVSEAIETKRRVRKPQAANDAALPWNPPDIVRLARAVAELREESGLNQDEFAHRAGWKSGQALQRYEAKGPVRRKLSKELRDEDFQDQLMGVIGLTRQALLDRVEHLRQMEEGGPPQRRNQGAREDGRPFEVAVDGRRQPPTKPPTDDLAGTPGVRDLSWMFNGGVRYMSVGGDAMTGYADPGTLIAYDISQKPTRGEGCVIELVTGERFLREFVRADTKRVHAAQRHPKVEVSWALAEVVGWYKVKARIDK